MWGGRTHTEVDWLLPGCSMDRMRERADRFRPFWEATDGRLKAKVRDDRLTAIVVRLGRYRRRGLRLRARLTPEGDGVRVRGRVAHGDLATLLTGHTSPSYQADLWELEGKVRSRFSGYRPVGVPWVAEPAHGAGNSPFRARPLIRFGRRPR